MAELAATREEVEAAVVKDRRGDQRGGEWEPIKIPSWNLAYIPKLPPNPLNKVTTSNIAEFEPQQHFVQQFPCTAKT
jgi:hypothetical protein